MIPMETTHKMFQVTKCVPFLSQLLESLEPNFKKQNDSLNFASVQYNTPNKTISLRFDPVKTPVEQGNKLSACCK